MNLFFFMARAVELLLVLPLCDKFSDCDTPAAIMTKFSHLPELEQIGVIAIGFIVISAIFEMVEISIGRRK